VLVLAVVERSSSQDCRPRSAPGSGICQDVNSQSCSGGQYYKGACPGASNIQCCVSNSGTGSSGSPSAGGGWGSYQPPASVGSLLGNLFTNVNPSRTNWGYKGAKATFMLPGGAIYIDSKMDTDCDGAPSCPSIDPSGQTQTSWTWKGSPINALKTNYFVLPSNLKGRLGSTKLGLGDIAAVLYNGNLEFAVYADNGPNDKIGEGSVQLVQNLGFNPYKNGKICCGIQSGVVVIVLPGTRGTYSTPYDSASVRQAGMERLNALTGGVSRAVSDANSEFTNDAPTTNSPSPIVIGLIVAALIVVVAVIVGIVLLVKHTNDVSIHEQRP